ncbi:putative adenylate-forming enzyme [Amphibacillus marinus]|uniref:Putative adenylate-forming enzyme n=1 Tax=Amphibacillus marinus TaxID=872970 RepID=A0A1H8L915_9BACI|nr:F390 synthetase-related protein [Amphibacillus marinus]SEO01674.1 putative adenylate-forming enzyme [Amphibacillus marinus]
MSIKKAKTFISTYLDISYQAFLNRMYPQRFRRLQARRLAKQLKTVVKHSPYYHSVVKDTVAPTYASFPIMNKNVMMREFDQLNTRGVSLQEAKAIALHAEESREFSPKLGDISVGLSSGTTGNQGVFLVSDQEVVQWAAMMMKKAINRKKFKNTPIVIAFFMRASNNLYTGINQKRITLHFFDLLTPVQENLTQLEQLRPNVIVAQPSMLREIASYYDQHERTYPLKDIFSVAEVLEQTDRDYIESKMKVPLKEIYQATEGFLGISCHEGMMHLNEDIVYIEKEYIDKKSRRFVPIITDLYRSTQPLVRYRHTDILVEQETPCPCGSSFIALERIEGREDDCFKVTTDQGLVRIFPDFIRYAITRASDAISQFQCIQHSEYEIEVLLEIDDKALKATIEETIIKQLQQLFPSACRDNLVITITFTKLDYQNDRKLRRVSSTFKESR